MPPPVNTCILLLASLALVNHVACKAIDINDQLPDLVEKHSDKSWLIKFYAPWCHHCQQLELTFTKVAAKLHHKHDNLVVGRVDCTKSGRVCEKYGVDSYPTIIHVNRDISIKYKGDRSEAAMVAFADRLQGPDVNGARSCNHLKEVTDKHGLVVLSNINNSSNEIRLQFESLAREHKSNHWFYHYHGQCKDFIHDEGLYLLKRHLNKPIKFVRPIADKHETNDESEHLKRALVDWINRESFAVYGQITYRNFERVVNSGRLVVLAVLDEYKPAKRFSAPSREFHKTFERLARKYAQHDTELLFGWSSDLELIEYITISPIQTPNVILLRSDLSYHLLVDKPPPSKQDKQEGEQDNDKLVQSKNMEKLRELNIRDVISSAKAGTLTFNGGNNYLYIIMRYTLGNLNKFIAMYRANPLLVSLIFGFPGLIIVFVIYTTCFNEGRSGGGGDDGDEDEDEFSDDEAEEERRRLLSNGHLKQD